MAVSANDSRVQEGRTSPTRTGHSDAADRSMSHDQSAVNTPLSTPDRPPLDLGRPIWTRNATDYTYEELGHGRDLPLPSTLNVVEDEGEKRAVGDWGEKLVYQYLLEQKQNGRILDFQWINESAELGKPYDFEMQYSDETGVHAGYIEVKSTMSDTKEVFDISVQQIKFASELREHFHIYRVFNAGNPTAVKLVRISDLNMRLAQNQVKLCMLI